MVTVADILSLKALALEPVSVPCPDAEVRWVATSELADPSPFLEGGEILLTTGLVERDADGWRQYATSLADAGVVALAFGVGLSHPDVPTHLVEAARASALNLVIVPRPVPFIAVSRAVADSLWAAERDADRESLQHQQTLTDAAVSGGTSELLSSLAGIVGGDALLTSPEGTVLATTAEPAAGSELAARALPHLNRIRSGGLLGAATEIIRDRRMTVHPVGVGARAEAYLVVESTSAAATAQRTAVTMAVALLTLDRERARVEQVADRRIRAGALSLALNSDTEAARALLAGASQTAVLPSSRATVVRARGNAAALDSVLTKVEREAASLGFPLVARLPETSADDQLVAIIPVGDIHGPLVQLLETLDVGIGPSRPLPAIAQSDDGARRALALASAVRPLVVWSELVEDGVDSLLDAGTLDAFAHNLLEAVLARPDATELVDSLHSFLVHNGHFGPAADSLGIHRNTLRNRLTTAESLLGRSVQDPQFRSDLWVALKRLLGEADRAG